MAIGEGSSIVYGGSNTALASMTLGVIGPQDYWSPQRQYYPTN
jgi:hypothetical protein